MFEMPRYRDKDSKHYSKGAQSGLTVFYGKNRISHLMGLEHIQQELNSRRKKKSAKLKLKHTIELKW